MKIFKYEIPIRDRFSILIPQYSKILTFQVQNGIPCIWVLAPEDQKLMRHEFAIYGTGMDIDSVNYIGSIQLSGLVWHLFLDYIKEIDENGK